MPSVAEWAHRKVNPVDDPSLLLNPCPYDSDEHIGYVACKKPISLVQGAYMFSARSVYV